MKKLARKLLKKIRIRTWIALSFIVILGPLTFVVLDRIQAARGGSDATSSAVWSFDEGVSNSCSGGSNDACDASGNGNDGAFGATTAAPTWQTEDMCVSGKCLYFDGTDDTITVANTVAGVKTVSFWVKSMTTTEQFIDLNGTAYITASAGAISATGFTSPTYYVDGNVTTSPTIAADNTWHHIAVTTGTGISASAITIGNQSTNYGNIFMDEVKLSGTALSAAQVKAEYAGGAASFTDTTAFLNQGLVGYWKMDGSSGNATDSSGNGTTLTNNATTTFSGGKFGNGSSHTAASSQYFSTASTISGVKTVSFWTKPTSTTDYYISLTSAADITSTTGTLSATGFTTPTIYVNGVQGTTIAANVWSFVTVTTETAIDANQFYVGRQSTNYLDGMMDEVRLYNRALLPREIEKLNGWSPGPTGYWPMDENGGQYVYDKSGYGNTGTLGDLNTVETDDPGWAAGIIGSSTTYDGGTSNKKVMIASGTGLEFDTGSFTVMAWVRRIGDASFQNPMYIVDHLNSSQGYELKIAGVSSSNCNDSGNNGTSACFTVSDGTDTYYAISAGISADAQWHHIAAVFDRQNESKILIYIDGVAQATTRTGTLANIGTVTTTDKFCIGIQESGANCSTSQQFNGNIDEVKIYNYARTQDQILQDVAGSHGNVFAEKPTSYWKLDEMSGTTAYDQYQRNNLDLAASPTWTNSGAINGAVDFESTAAQYASAGDSASLSLTGDLTLTAWIKPESVTAATRFPIAGKLDGTNTDYLLEQYGDEIRMYIGSTSNYVTTDATNLQTATWYHIAGVYNAINQTVSIYVGGELQAATTTGTIPSSITDHDTQFYLSSLTPDYPTVTSITETTVTSDSTTHNVAMPASVSTGDLLVVLLTTDGNATVTDPDGAGGWTEISTLTRSTFARGTVYAIDALGTEGGTTVNFATSSAEQASAQVYLIPAAQWYGTLSTGVEAASADPGGITAAPNPPSLAPTNWSTGDTLWIAYAGGSSWTSAFSSPTGFSTYTHTISGTGTAGTSATSATMGSGAASADPGSFSMSTSSSGVVFTVAIRPATSGSQNTYDGVIDDVKVYSTSLTAEQVQIDMNANASANFGTGADEASALTDGAGSAPILRWKLDENSGTTAADTSGSGLDGTLTNSPVWTIGKYGSAVQFAGSNQHITTADSATLDFGAGGSFTIETWFKHDTASAQEVILSKYNEAGYKMIMEADGDITCAIDYDSTWTPTDSATSTAATYDDGKWHHLVCVKDANTSLTLYIDGTQIAQDTTLTNSTLANSDPLYYGIDADGTSNDFIGTLDNLNIYNYARTLAQVNYDYNRGKPLGWWKMDECTGATVYDNAQNGNGDAMGNNGTVTIGATVPNTSTGTCSSGTGTEAWNNGTTGKRNASIDLDGVDDYITVGSTSVFDLTGSLTLSAWIYPTGWGSGGFGFIFNRRSGTTGYGFYVRQSSQSLSFCINGTTCNSATSNTISLSTWQHVAVVYTAGTQTFYVNGKLIQSQSVGTLVSSSNTLFLGAATASTGLFDGQLDDLRIYNYALSANQIKQVMNEGAVRFGPDTGSP